MSRAICLEDLRVEESAEGLEVSCACISDVGDFPGRLRAGIAGLEAGRAPDSLDWAAVALLLPAMAEGRDIVVRGALSRRLLHALNHDIQGVLTVLAPELRRIRIEAEAAAPDHRAPTGRIGTGFSAGIDSFATLSLYDPRSAEDTPKITDLAVFDVGAFGPPGSAQAGALFDRSARRCREVAARLGLGAVTVGSNLGALYAGRFPFQRSHTLRNVAAALLLGRHLDLHLYSSSYGPHHVAVQETHDIAFLDPVLLPMLSTGRMELYSAGAGLTRAEKTVRVARDPDAGTLLDVCITPADRRPADRPNCSRCWKCRRAMVTFDLLGVLDDFAPVFDVAYYRRNRRRIHSQLAISARDGRLLDQEAIQWAREAGTEIRPTPADLLRWRVRRARSVAKRVFPFAGRMTAG